MFSRLGLVLAWALLLAPVAQADQPDCAGSQYDMNQCASRTLQAEDRVLNQRYQAALAAAPDATAKDLLRRAQRSWLAYRDATCAWEGDAARGGSLRPLLEVVCADHMTRQRLLELSRSLEQRDPGLVAGVMLARIRESAPEAVLRGVFWLPETTLAADFNGDGMFDLVAVGLTPPASQTSDAKDTGGMVHVLLLPAGLNQPLHAAIPIGGDGFCAAPAAVRTETPDGGGRPLIAIDDGACAIFRIGLTPGDKPALLVVRN